MNNSNQVVTYTFGKVCKVNLAGKTINVKPYDVLTVNFETNEVKLNNITQ